jgi:hypothetical protein
MWNVKDHSKLIFSTFGIIFGSFFVNVYLNKNRVNESTAGVVLKFNDNIEQSWIKELHEYIAQNIDKPYSRWDNNSFTKEIGHCHATCSDDRNNGDIFYGSGCQTHPVYVYDREVTDSLLSTMPYGEATAPCFLKLTKSKIPNANRGIFTTKYKLPKGMIFGPYTGVIRSAYGDDGQEARDGGYAWRINRWNEENADFYIDGVNENNSNWLRYVNTARYREEQNVFSLLFNDTVYYITIKDIEPETELLVWYGYKYAKWLNIFVVETSAHDWDHDYAPPVDETICPSCPRTEGIRRKENDDDDDDEENENGEQNGDEEEQSSCRGEQIEGDIEIDDPDFDMSTLDIRKKDDDEEHFEDNSDDENVIEPADSSKIEQKVESVDSAKNEKIIEPADQKVEQPKTTQ